MAAPITYRVGLAQRDQHLVRVRLDIAAADAAGARLAIPTWTPGSYFERHYARFVQQASAQTASGQPVELHMPDTHSWVLPADLDQDVVVTFELYAHELGVRNNHVDDHHALLVGASTFPFVESTTDREHRVSFEDVDGPVWSLLPEQDGTFVADDYLHLVDSAFEVGEHRQTSWETAGVEHVLVWSGHGGHPDLAAMAEWGKKITDTAVELFGGDLPVADRYTFLAVGGDKGGGGLEHRDGSVLMMPVTTFQDDERLAVFQSLVAHEYFHLWNVKRLVPAALVEPDLLEPAHTESLWVAEGWTAFYDEVLPVRAGVWKLPTYLKKAANQAHTVLQAPGARLQSVRRASHEAWIKQYIRDENTPNVGVNYYPHGAVLAWCLDLMLRQANPDGNGLDDALRLLWQRLGNSDTGYTERDVQDVVNEVAGTSLDGFFDEYVGAPAIPPIKTLVEVVGLRFAPATEDRVPHLGVMSADEPDGVVLTNVLRGGPAWKAGLSGGDRLLAIDGQRVASGDLKLHLKATEPGQSIDVAVFRGPRLLHRTVVLGPHQAPDRLLRVEAPTDQQKRAFKGWLGVDLDDVPAE